MQIRGQRVRAPCSCSTSACAGPLARRYAEARSHRTPPGSAARLHKQTLKRDCTWHHLRGCPSQMCQTPACSRAH